MVSDAFILNIVQVLFKGRQAHDSAMAVSKHVSVNINSVCAVIARLGEANEREGPKA